MIVEKQKKKRIQRALAKEFYDWYGICFDNHRIILVTGHWRESFGKELENVCYGFKRIAEHFKDVKVIYPVHLNPNVERPVKNILRNIPNVHLLKPLDYYSFVYLLSRSFLILTDSGGIQEEAPSLGKPVLVLGKTTERPEGAEAGTARLVGTSSEAIFDGAASLLENATLYGQMARAANRYGDGNASGRIMAALLWEFGLAKKLLTLRKN